MPDEKPKMIDGDGPSAHGKLLGEALAVLAEAGARDGNIDVSKMCATCAFRKGSMPNESAGTGKVALDCVLGVDKDRFACHHGMKAGEPQKLCVGYIAARVAPIRLVREVIAVLMKSLDEIDRNKDEVRAAYEAWLKEIDPEGKLDVYQLGREYAKRPSGAAT